jgi:predicted RNA-binding Zn-ribbon protein involved in translation (DUF1610 family)
MARPFLDLMLPDERYGSYKMNDDISYALYPCPDCGGTQMYVVAFTRDESRRWLWCANCKLALVDNDGDVAPSELPLRVPAGVAGVELAAWKEARVCLGAGAYTAAVMMCRKLLFHIAVAHGLPAKNEKDRAPTYAQAVEHLESEGIITARMRPWIDRIKDVGNDANHEIVPINADVARDVATFTEQLLRLTYEMDALMTAAHTEVSNS